jgi:hypothetical protein
MKKLNISILSLLIILVLAACTNKAGSDVDVEEEIHPILVDLQVPETTEVGNDIVVTARVTHGDEVVSDASEVTFEILDNTTGEKNMVDADWDGKEFYTTTLAFETSGVYSITSHVTARDMHTMPTKKVTVEGPEAETASEDSVDEHHHHHGAEITLDAGNPKTGEQTALKTEVVIEGKKLAEASVRFEIWMDGSEKHDWVNAKETEAGVYEGTHEFAEKGNYFVQIHVEKDKDLHEHTTVELSVE